MTIKRKTKQKEEGKDTRDLKKLQEGRDYEINEQGLLVFTASYLLRRGYCCGNGCRHCPYQKTES